MGKFLFTSESVTAGHPDKVSDSVSDAILDAMLAQDPMSRVACETLTNTGFIMIMGEITTKANVDITQIVRDTICEIGYTDSKMGFDGNSCAVMVALDKQSPDIAMGVKDGDGAGDQGMMFGYACKDTDKYLPTAMVILQELSQAYDELRKKDERFKPDGKAQITGIYENNKQPVDFSTGCSFNC